MNKYLEKIAKEYLHKTELDNPDVGNKVGAAATTGVTAMLVEQKLGPMLQRPVMNKLFNSKSSLDDSITSNILSDSLARTNTTLDHSLVGGNYEVQRELRKLPDTVGPFYLPHTHMDSFANHLDRKEKLGSLGSKILSKIGIGEPVEYTGRFKKDLKPFTKNFIGFGSMTNNKDVLVHEMGHAEDFSRGNVKLKHLAANVGRKVGTVSGLVGGAMLASNKTRDYAWTAPWVGAASTLREEFMANKLGYDLIKKHGGNPRKFLGLAAANMAGYLIKPTLTSATIAGINYARKKGEEFSPEEYLSDRY